MKPIQPPCKPKPSASHPDFDRGPARPCPILLATTALFFVLLFAWMSFAALDISVNAQGAVIPSSRVQQIQSMEGGILQAWAREGMQVKGRRARHRPEPAVQRRTGEAQQGLWGAQAALVRLDAEARNVHAGLPRRARKNAPDIVREQRTLADPPPGAREQPRDPRPPARPAPAKLAEARARHQAIGEAIGPARALAIEGKTGRQRRRRADLLAAQQRYTSQKGELETTRIAIGHPGRSGRSPGRLSTRPLLAETSRRRNGPGCAPPSSPSGSPVATTRSPAASCARPMDGVVNRLLITTVGGVVKGRNHHGDRPRPKTACSSTPA